MKKILSTLVILVSVSFSGEIKVLENNATDPVYILPLKKYPKWLCEAKLQSGKKVQFSSVKSMMTVYFHQPYYKKHKFIDSNITKLYVQDYLTGKKVDAKKAKYVFGSRIVGPHGDDLIPFSSDENAKIFMLKNGGTKVLPFGKVSKGLIKYLDM